MNKKLVSTLLNFIEENSISKNNVNYECFKKHTEIDVCEPTNVSVLNDDLGMTSEIFKFTPKNFIERLTWKNDYCYQVCRKLVGKKYRDFTKNDCEEFLNILIPDSIKSDSK